MREHRSTQARVSNDPQLSNFEPGTALENLRAEMIDIEALARAAEAAADGLPTPTTDRQRLAYGRIQSLATKTSQQASASLRFANAQVTALTAQRERAGAPRVTGAPAGPEAVAGPRTAPVKIRTGDHRDPAVDGSRVEATGRSAW